MKRALLAIMIGALYVLHQDFWFWRTATPLAFGFIPVGLFYHACYTVVVALAFGLLVKLAWPSHLEESSVDFSLREVPPNKANDNAGNHTLKSGPPAEGNGK